MKNLIQPRQRFVVHSLCGAPVSKVVLTMEYCFIKAHRCLWAIQHLEQPERELNF